MKLAAWRTTAKLTQQRLAEELGVSQAYISLLERATNPRIPDRETMKKIYVHSQGQVAPNDFYDIPAWEADLIRAEAEAEMARKAA